MTSYDQLHRKMLKVNYSIDNAALPLTNRRDSVKSPNYIRLKRQTDNIDASNISSKGSDIAMQISRSCIACKLFIVKDRTFYTRKG